MTSPITRVPPAGVTLEPEYFGLAASLGAVLSSRLQALAGRRIVIGIAGESGSGKSVTALCLARELESAGIATGVLHQDDYFHLPPRTNHEARCRDLANVGTHEVDMEALARVVAAFRMRQDGVTSPVVDYPNNQFQTQRLDFSGWDALIVEGTYVLAMGDMDVRIFLEATHESTRERRRARNRDIDSPIIEDILRIEHEIIARQAAVADVVIAPDFTISRAK